MAIKVTNGFEVRAAQPIDTRILLTKAEMVAIKDPLIPDNYFCICKDDGKLYIYNKTFEATTELGKFRAYEELIDISKAINKAMESPTTKAQLETAIAVTLPGALEDTMSTSEGAQKVADALFDSEHFEVTLDNKIDLAISVIQAIDGN